MADHNPLDPLAARLDQIIDSFREAALEDELVTIPDGRTLLASEHEALMTFARANGISEERLWKGVSEISPCGRVTVGNFVWCEVTDPSALAHCTKIENLALARLLPFL